MTVAELLPAHLVALRQVGKGDIYAMVQPGIVPKAVRKVGAAERPGIKPAHAQAFSDPAFRALREQNLVTWDTEDPASRRGGGGGVVFPLRLTAEGMARLGKAISKQEAIANLEGAINDALIVWGQDDPAVRETLLRMRRSLRECLGE